MAAQFAVARPIPLVLGDQCKRPEETVQGLGAAEMWEKKPSPGVPRIRSS